MTEYHLLCGGAELKNSKNFVNIVRLNVQGKEKNVDLKIESISKALLGNIPDVLLDLLEISAYVYCADQQIRRGSETLAEYGTNWYRRMNFHIPVRMPGLWNSVQMRIVLIPTIDFLAGESYEFTFVDAAKPRWLEQPYFEFEDINSQPDEVALFSGGLDSFAGAIESLVGHKKKMALIGHHSSNEIKGIQANLVDSLKTRGLSDKIHYIPVKVRNTGVEAAEYTQRTRSFLFACLAACIARMLGKDSFTFFENGVVSLNIPISGDVLGSRATRTTHPRIIKGFQDIFSVAFDADFRIDHPYQWLTKAEVVTKIHEYGFEALLGDTNSCTRQNRKAKRTTHCGACSQCIDRRFAILASGLEAHEDAEKYKIDLLTGDRNRDREMVMAASYLKFAQKFQMMPLENLLSEHPDVSAALAHFDDLTTEQAERKIYELYRRHTSNVLDVVRRGLDLHKDRLIRGNLSSTCLLSLFLTRSQLDISQAPNYGYQLKDFVARLDGLEAPSCEFYVNENSNKIDFSGGFSLKDSNYNLIMALLMNFRDGKKSGSEIKAIRACDLADQLKIDETSLRRRITRCREEVSQHLSVGFGIVLREDDFIENLPGKGYRLNRAIKEVVTAEDLKT